MLELCLNWGQGWSFLEKVGGAECHRSKVLIIVPLKPYTFDTSKPVKFDGIADYSHYEAEPH